MTRPVSQGHVARAASVAEPCRPLSRPLHYPLVFVLLTWHLTLIQHNRLHSWGPQWASFHCSNLLPNQTSLLAHLSITEATKDVFLFQVAALWTWLDVVLREGHREKHCKRSCHNKWHFKRTQFYKDLLHKRLQIFLLLKKMVNFYN